MATQLPTMNDHADAVHPLHTQPDRQMDPWNQQTTAYNAKAKMRERGY